MWTLDIASGDLCHEGVKVGCLNQSDTLVFACLIYNLNVLVSKDLLLDAGWSGRVVASNSLTATIKNIRKLISDFDTDIFIETVHRKGYILKADVESIKLIEIAASNQIKVSETLETNLSESNKLNQSDIIFHQRFKEKFKKNQKISFEFKNASYVFFKLCFCLYFVVTVVVGVFVLFKPAELYCYKIKNSDFCGLFELNSQEQKVFFEKYTYFEGFFYYGYDETLDEIKVYSVN